MRGRAWRNARRPAEAGHGASPTGQEIAAALVHVRSVPENPRVTRRLRPLSLACLLLLATGGSRAASPPPRKLVVLATVDMKGKTSPCGCHVPKGGFARIASYLDSTRAAQPATLYVDDGGAFPEQDGRTDLAEFMYRSLVQLRVAAIGVGPRDLRHGVAFL